MYVTQLLMDAFVLKMLAAAAYASNFFIVSWILRHIIVCVLLLMTTGTPTKHKLIFTFLALRK